MDALDDRAVVKRDHFNAGCVSARVTELVELINGRVLKPDNLHRPPSRDGHDGAKGMRAVECRAKVVAPVRRVAVGNIHPARGAVVDVFAFRISDVADGTLLVLAPHFKGQIHVAVIFRVGVDKTRFLNGLDQFHRLRHRLARKHLAHDVLSRFQTPDGIRRVLRCVIGKDDRVHVVGKEVLEVVEHLDGKSRLLRAFLCTVQKRLILVTDSDQLRLRMMQKHLDHRISACAAEDTDS